MATLILRPAADISVTHSKHKNNVDNPQYGYDLINETQADNDTTYIYNSANGSTNTKTSSFRLDAPIITNRVRINSITIHVNAATEGETNTSTIDASVGISGILVTVPNFTQTSFRNSYSDYSKTFTESDIPHLSDPIDNMSSLSFTLYLKSAVRGSALKEGGIKITQSYISIDYDILWVCKAIGIDNMEDVSVSEDYVVDGTTCTFSAKEVRGTAFRGWFDSPKLDVRVSSDNNYTTPIRQDTTYYTTAEYIKVQHLYRKRDGKWIEPKAIYINRGGKWEQLDELTSDIFMDDFFIRM